MKLFPAFCFLILLNIVSFGQLAQEDIDRLRQFLNIPAPVSITVAMSDRLVRDDAPLRVFLATGADATARRKQVGHIASWNKSRNAKRYGTIEVVDDLFSADVALIKQSFPNAAGTMIVPAVVHGTRVYDKVTRATVDNTITTDRKIRPVPFQVHILRRTPETIEIVRAASSVEILQGKGSDGVADNLLWDLFRELLIHR